MIILLNMEILAEDDDPPTPRLNPFKVVNANGDDDDLFTMEDEVDEGDDGERVELEEKEAEEEDFEDEEDEDGQGEEEANGDEKANLGGEKGAERTKRKL